MSLLRSTTVEAGQAQRLALFLIFLPLFFFAYFAVKRGIPIALRPIAGFATLKQLLAQSAEAGQPVHLSLGIGGIGDQSTADTTAGLTVLEYLAERAAVSGTPPIVTMANPTALLAAQDTLRRAYRRHGYPEDYDPNRARFIAPDPVMNTGVSPNPVVYAGGQNDALAYGAGTMHLLNRRKLIANVMLGRFGDEFLLLGETGAQRQLNQIGGTSAVRVLPFVQASVAHPLVGEEIYAGGAYLSNKPAHVGSLLAQDMLRWLLAAGLAAAVVLKTLGLM